MSVEQGPSPSRAPAVVPGSQLAPLVRTIDLRAAIAYAGATWDWYRGHYDPEFVATQGLPGVFVDGQMLGALLAESVQDHLGPRARLRRLSFRFTRMVLVADTVTCHGVVRSVTDSLEGTLIDIDHHITVGEQTVLAPAHSQTLLARW